VNSLVVNLDVAQLDLELYELVDFSLCKLDLADFAKEVLHRENENSRVLVRFILAPGTG